MRLDEKKQIVEELHQKFEKSKIVIITDYKGLNVEDVSSLRRKFRDANVEYKVVKNTLLVLASKDTDVSVIRDYFKGPSAVALSYDDPVAPAKVLAEFAKSNPKLEIKVGALSGRLLDLDAINALSALPPREVLLGQVLGAMNAVPAGFVQVLSQIIRQMINVLQAIRDQKDAA
ncbi:MAG: 50S ribosomal protein L10 [Desulfobacterales bacterium]|nr:50S ribosomal protein L10 [Desulfobacterales bacterium]